MTLELTLRPFQETFIKAVENPKYDICALSIPRGNAKSWIAAHIIKRALTPGDSLYVDGKEVVLLAGSLDQARIIFNYCKYDMEMSGVYKFNDAGQRLSATHIPSGSRLRVISSNARTAYGLVNTPLVICDEPGVWHTVGGGMMWDALTTAQAKPGSPLKIIVVGTLAPASSGWWHDIVKHGTHRTTYVQSLQGDRDSWDSYPTIRKANPLVSLFPETRGKLLELRDGARGDSRLKATFLSYHLNLPTADESKVLLTIPDFDLWTEREVVPRAGAFIVGADIGQSRAWSAATAAWQSGRVEALAVTPGIPNILDQERRDRVPSGTYQRLVDDGLLFVADGLRSPPPSMLWDAIKDRWGVPASIVCDFLRLAEFRDATQGEVGLETRRARWSESTYDIRALREFVRDGPLSLAEESRALVEASLSVADVENDSSGNTRMKKRGYDNAARDDIASALVLLAGAWKRAGESAPSEIRHVVV